MRQRPENKAQSALFVATAKRLEVDGSGKASKKIVGVVMPRAGKPEAKAKERRSK
jgi:hypothetical protein